ncbi:hypothetical protein CRYUN_Cryun12cG0117600 [Craigia yunnanensis]
MPCYSAIFQGFLWPTAMSLRPTSLQLNNTPKHFLKPSFLSFLSKTQSPGSFRRLHLRHGLVTCSRSGTASSSSSSSSSRTLALDWRNMALPYLQQQQISNYGRYAYQDVSSDESDHEFGSPQSQMGASTLDNIDEWRWKLTMLLRNKDEQEVV